MRYSKAVLVLQKTYRMVAVRQLFLVIRQATVTIQAFTRGALARRRYRRVSILTPASASPLGAHAGFSGCVFDCQFSDGVNIDIINRCRAETLPPQLVAERAAVALQARVRGWLARRRYKQVRAAVVFMQCCARRRAARRELLKLKTEARSVERFRELNKGMEVKLMQLQLKADYQVGGDRWDLGRGQREHDVWMCAGQGERRSEGDAAG